MRYFKGKQFKKDIILVAVGYYCRFSLSYRDIFELLRERGISVHPTTIMRWGFWCKDDFMKIRI
ncbi:transposase [Bacillus thuringiensis]|nr:transposase [Bacillus thuringiensis]MBG9585505.1 transposase [Bacillus thuringiensis]